MHFATDPTQPCQLAAINAVPNHLAFSDLPPPENLHRTGRWRGKFPIFCEKSRFSAP